MMVQCCVCKRIRRGKVWEWAAKHHHDASHTYCPPCAEIALAEIDAYRNVYAPPPARRTRLASLQDLFQPRQPLDRITSDRSF